MAIPAHLDAFIDLMVEALVREIEGECAEGARQPDDAPAARGSKREKHYQNAPPAQA